MRIYIPQPQRALGNLWHSYVEASNAVTELLLASGRFGLLSRIESTKQAYKINAYFGNAMKKPPVFDEKDERYVLV